MVIWNACVNNYIYLFSSDPILSDTLIYMYMQYIAVHRCDGVHNIIYVVHIHVYM